MATLAVAAMALTGCSGSGGDQAAIHVSPHTSRMVQPVSTRISGLEGGQKVTVTLTSNDARGMHWSSSARFTADKDGDIDLGSDKPIKGDYHDADDMGLMEALAPEDPSKPASYARRRHGKPQSFTLAVRSASGSPLAKTTFQRRFAPDVTSSAQSVGKQGFDGVYYHKVGAPPPAPRRPAVLAFGGSEGGSIMGILGKPLAASGFPTLTIAYFHAPGLPHDLKKIPSNTSRKPFGGCASSRASTPTASTSWARPGTPRPPSSWRSTIRSSCTA